MGARDRAAGGFIKSINWGFSAAGVVYVLFAGTGYYFYGSWCAARPRPAHAPPATPAARRGVERRVRGWEVAARVALAAPARCAACWRRGATRRSCSCRRTAP